MIEHSTKPLEELRKIRIDKLQKLKDLGVNPYVSDVPDRIAIAHAKKEKEKSEVFVAGRLISFRSHGKIVFADLRDESGQIQLAFKKDALEKKLWDLLPFLDMGDFIWVSGENFVTKAGELTILVKDFKLLTKSIRPLPSVWYGFKDEEARYRQRYVDILLNNDLKELFSKKALFWQTVRNFLLEKGFFEVETPVLESIAGGADATPFVTHHNALDIDLYLRISMGELWQKRLMVAGFEKTFEIGRQFRNEGISREHLQDYTQMEFYWAYANYEDSMRLVEKLYKEVAHKVFGTLTFEINGHKVDLGKKWERIDYAEVIKKYLDIDIKTATDVDITAKLKKINTILKGNETRGRLLDMLWKNIRKNITGPAFLVGHPVEVSPLAKRNENNPKIVERYQIIIAGSELGNGYTELNDPLDQKKRFEEQQKMRDAGDSEAQMHDYDFVRALEYGMPPVTGFGLSERLFAFLMNKSARECVMFPLLRPESM
ncbi:MAG: lysine--tRNA ligase [Patescibacteria group bacterium]|nr:lysine--tRNA ligase [Patescibacteria group bacterium]